jgi:PPIC-type PPIASE domain
MASVNPTADQSTTGTTARRLGLPGWAREPLLHFVLLGAALFGVDHVIASREADPRVIVVDAEVDKEAIEVFKAQRGAEPNADELYALRRVWLDNEVLYREGLAMQLDKGDKSIRERVIFKALSVVDANAKLPKFDDATLREWFEKHHARYDEPSRYDFQEAVLSGDKSESAVRAFVNELNAGTPGEKQAGLRVFTGRPHANIVQSYGEEFAKELESLPRGEWRAIKSSSGLRIMRLEAVSEARPASFDALRGIVLQDWTDATMSEQRSNAVRALAKKYTITVQADTQ